MNRYMKSLAVIAACCTSVVALSQVATPLQPTPAASTTLATPASTSAAAGAAADSNTHALTAGDLASFFDGLVPFALQRGDVAGGVISVVKDGKIIFARGYGYSDLKTRAVPSPQDTLFRMGSTSKLFTWTAVMQLVQAGKLNLDEDINRYLDFKIPSYQGKPITLRNIMTQSPGFEDVTRNLISTNGKAVNLEKYLKTHLPVRIFAPGALVAYSNYGCGLAGYIVQRVSGQDFDDYVEQHLFKPLKMNYSTFRQPLPPRFAPLMAESYATASDGVPKAFEILDPAPAGALSSTASDMAHFMIAHLQGGIYDGARILDPATVKLMHTPQRTEGKGLNGYALGFYQENRNGQRIVGHAGDLDYFHTDLHLLLDSDVGVFMSFNSLGNAGGAHVIRTAVFSAFLNRYFPAPREAKLPTVSTAKADAARVSGWYRSSRRNESGISMLYALGQSKISALPNGDLLASGINDPAGKPLQWREVAPLHYQQVDGPYHLDFTANNDGSIRYWATDAEPPVFIFQRVSGLRTLGSIKLWGTLSLLFILATLVSWPFGWWTRRHYGRPLALSLRQRQSRLGSRLGALLLFIPLLGWLILLMAIGANQVLLLDGTAAPWMYQLYVLGVLALLGVLAIVIHMVVTWMTPRRSRWVLLGETLLALCAIYLGWLILAFGMVSFNTQF